MKIKLLAAAAVVLVGGVVGLQVYADQQLKALYFNQESAQSDKRINIQNKKFSMGLFSGKAGADIRITPDLCQPNRSFRLRFEDKIERRWSGYAIWSKIYLLSDNGTEQPVNLNIQTLVGWNRSGHTRVVLPAGEAGDLQRGKVSWKEATANVDWHYAEQDVLLKNYDMHIPSIQVMSPSTRVSLTNIRMTGQQDDQKNLFQNSQSDLTLEQMNVQGAGAALVLNGMKAESRQEIVNDKLNVKIAYRINEIQNAGQTLNNLRFNLQVKDITRGFSDTVSDLLKQQEQKCVNTQDFFNPLVSSLLSQGIRIESTDNGIDMGGSKATLDADLTIVPSAAPATQNTQALIQALMQATQYHAALSIDKSLLAAVANGKPLPQTDEEWEQELAAVRAKLPPNVIVQNQSNAIVFTAKKQ